MKIALVAAFLVASLPSPSRAEDLDRDNEIAIRLGGYGTGAKIKLDGEDKVADGGGALGVRYLHNVDNRVGLGIEANLLNAGEHESTTLITNGISKTKLRTAEILGIVRVRFGKENFRPYVLGGLGLDSTTLSLDTHPQAGLVWLGTGTSETRTLMDSTKTGVALALETGFDYHFNPAVSAGASIGLHLLSERTYTATPAGQALGLTGVKGGFSGAMIGGSFLVRF